MKAISTKELKKQLDMKLKYQKAKHEMKMQQMKAIQDNDRIHHERELERMRIRSAEIRKSQMRGYTGNPYKA